MEKGSDNFWSRPTLFNSLCFAFWAISLSLIFVMKLNKKKNIALLITAAFLFVALFDGWPYGFFTLLRFVVFASSAYVAWMTYEAQKEKWVWVFGFLAVLFNPFIIIHLNRELWSAIDLIVGVFMIVSVFALKLGYKQKVS